MVRVLPMAIVLLVLVLSLGTQQAFFIPLHLLTFFLVAMVCHGELARLRPSARHLTGFYLAMSLGGVLGGIFNALVAPVVFDWVAEYPLALVLACLALPRAPVRARPPGSGRGFRALASAPAAGRRDPPGRGQSRASKFACGVAAFLCYTLKDRPVRFASRSGPSCSPSRATRATSARVLLQERDFFGVLRVAHDLESNSHRLIHGNTLHGQQASTRDVGASR